MHTLYVPTDNANWAFPHISTTATVEHTVTKHSLFATETIWFLNVSYSQGSIQSSVKSGLASNPGDKVPKSMVARQKLYGTKLLSLQLLTILNCILESELQTYAEYAQSKDTDS